MKVKCINNEFGKRCITVGRIYEVVEDYAEFYYVFDDRGEINYFFKERFVNCDKEYRTERLKDILNES